MLRFAWRVKAYYLLLAVAWCGVPVFFIGLMMLVFPDNPHPIAGWVTGVGWGIAMLPVFAIRNWLWRCPNCKAWMNPRHFYPSSGVDCIECGAVLYNPRGFYADPQQARNPRAGERDGNHYWIDPAIQSVFRWRMFSFRAMQGIMMIAWLPTLGGLFTELWFFWVSGGLILIMIIWVWRAYIWRCAHCGDRLDENSEYPGRGQVLCHSCGAVLWEAVPATPASPPASQRAHRDVSKAGGAYFHTTESFQRAMSRHEDEMGHAIDAQDFDKLSRLMDNVEAETRREIHARTDERLRKAERDIPPAGTNKLKKPEQI